jgi:hypothetical protein
MKAYSVRAHWEDMEGRHDRYFMVVAESAEEAQRLAERREPLGEEYMVSPAERHCRVCGKPIPYDEGADEIPEPGGGWFPTHKECAKRVRT